MDSVKEMETLLPFDGEVWCRELRVFGCTHRKNFKLIYIYEDGSVPVLTFHDSRKAIKNKYLYSQNLVVFEFPFLKQRGLP